MYGVKEGIKLGAAAGAGAGAGAGAFLVIGGVAAGVYLAKEINKVFDDYEKLLKEDLKRHNEYQKGLQKCINGLDNMLAKWDSPSECYSNPCRGCKAPSCPNKPGGSAPGGQRPTKDQSDSTGHSGGSAPGGDQQPNNPSSNEDATSTTERLVQLLIELLGLILRLHHHNSYISDVDRHRILFRVFGLVGTLLQRGFRFTRQPSGLRNRDNPLRDLYLESPDGQITICFDSHLASFFNLNIPAVGGAAINSRCPRTLQAEMGQDGFRLSIGECNRNRFQVYGLSCRLCGRQSNTSETNLANIGYVGLTTKDIHLRVCNGHASKIRQGRVTLAQHISSDHPHAVGLPFQDIFDVFILPIERDGISANRNILRSWELFWQWLCRALEDFGGRSRR